MVLLYYSFRCIGTHPVCYDDKATYDSICTYDDKRKSSIYGSTFTGSCPSLAFDRGQNYIYFTEMNSDLVH